MTATISNDPYITSIRGQTQMLWNAYLSLLAMQEQWNALDYGTTLMDGTGANSHVTAAQTGAVIFDAMNAIKTVLATGVATNLAQLL